MAARRFSFDSRTSDRLCKLQNNLAAAKSRIIEMDVTQECTNSARANILAQAGSAMLAHHLILKKTPAAITAVRKFIFTVWF